MTINHLRRVASAVAALILVPATLVAVAQPASAAKACGSFPDVSTSNQFCADINWLSKRGITGGYSDGGFHPTAPVSRQAMAAFLHRLAVPDDNESECDPQTFNDVKESNTFCADITWLNAQGITGGYSDGGFHPTAPVSRQAMAAFLHRLAVPNDTHAWCGTSFPDTPKSNEFCADVTWLDLQQVTSGYRDGGFHPTAPVSRQAMAAFLHRIYVFQHTNHTFSDGMYKVGRDIAPGLYRARVPEGSVLCSWERRSDASGSTNAVIAQDLAEGYALIQVHVADPYISSDGCGTWHLVSESDRWKLGGKIPGDGMFVVGQDVRPGTYHQTGYQCFWARRSGASGMVDFGEIIALDAPSGPSYVTIRPTDKIFVTSNCSTFIKVH